ncbi:hypothetical protein PMAYCL1PPCAC_04029, partial [Pristionchus mayeri]
PTVFTNIEGDSLTISKNFLKYGLTKYSVTRGLAAIAISPHAQRTLERALSLHKIAPASKRQLRWRTIGKWPSARRVRSEIHYEFSAIVS